MTETRFGEEKKHWVLHDRVFSVENMYRKLTFFANSEGLEQVKKALPYAKKCHEGQYRYPAKGKTEKVPYIIHPLVMCCQAHALGLHDDVILTSILLHDVCEDCGVDPEELPFTADVQRAVWLVTKDEDRFATLGKADALREYYEGIRTSKTAMVVKCIDRCNNISSMALSFPPEKMKSYILETEQYIIPMLDEMKLRYMDLNDAAFLLKYQIRSTMETQKAMLM